MFELQQEKTIMYSDDKTLELTSYRVIHHVGKKKIQIMLEDFLNCELKTSHIGNYKVITIVLAIIGLPIMITQIDRYFEERKSIDLRQSFFDFLFTTGLLWFSFVLLSLSLFFLAISRRYLVRINGKFDSIEFRVTSFRKRSVKKFLQTLVDQSKIVKEEKQKAL